MSTCQRLSSDAGRLTGLMHDCNRRSMILDLGGTLQWWPSAVNSLERGDRGVIIGTT